MAVMNDGSIPYGSRVLTIAAVAFVAEDIEISQASTLIERMNELGADSGAVNTEKTPTGSATLQLATTATVTPAINATFAETFDALWGAKTYFLVTVGKRYAQGEAQKVPVTFRQKINA